MKLILILIFVIYSWLCISQSKIYLGVKLNYNKEKVIRNKRIDELNLAFKKKYFKIEKENYKPIGIYGKNIEPYLKMSDKKIKIKFEEFKKNKLYGYLNLFVSFTFISSWVYRGVVYNLSTGNDNITQFVLRNKQYVYLISSMCFFSFSIYFDVKSSKYLRQCVLKNNNLLDR